MVANKKSDFRSKRHKLESCTGNEPTQSQYRLTVKEINKLKSVDEALALAERNREAQCVLHSKRIECDCNYQQSVILANRVQRNLSGKKG